MKRQMALFSAEDEGFKRFWAAFPRRVAKKAALKAWAELKPSSKQVDRMLQALAWQVWQPEWAEHDGKFIPYPATWLRAARWEDERPAPKADARGHIPPCRTNTECNRKLEQEIEARKAGAGA